MSQLNHYKRSTVRSTESSVFIDKKHFPEIIRRLKAYKSKNKKLQKRITVWAAISDYHWMVGFDKDGNISSLKYRGQEHTTSAMIFISVVATYVKPGGYIKMSNENSNQHWVYKFDGRTSRRHTMISKIIDFEDKDGLENLFGEITFNMMRLGTTKTELISLVKKLFIQKILK